MTTRPRVWVRAQYYDPDLPIRGRYLSERLEMPAEEFSLRQAPSQGVRGWYLNREWAHLQLHDGHLTATREGAGPGAWVHLQMQNGLIVAQLEEPVLIFVPERASVPRTTSREEEMWVEVTLPIQGPPRPLRIGIKKNGILTPLKFE